MSGLDVSDVDGALSRPTPPTAPLRGATRLDELCDTSLAGAARGDLVYWFVRLAAWLRPRAGESLDARVRFFERALERDPARRANVAGALDLLVEGSRVEELLSHGGLPAQFHLVGAVRAWLREWTLPQTCDTDDAAAVLRLAFRGRDAAWLSSARLIGVLSGLLSLSNRALVRRAAARALVALGHQIAAQKGLPTVRRLGQSPSAFDALYDTIVASAGGNASATALPSAVSACRAELDAMRAAERERGADVNTTFQLERMRLQLLRVETLAAALRGDDLPRHIGAVLTACVREGRGFRIVLRSTSLLAANVVDAASTTGRAYVGGAGAQLWPAFKAGLAGGGIMALATVVKLGILRLGAPPLYEGMLVALGYGLAFTAAYFLHATIATKLPANVAATFARALGADLGVRVSLRRFWSASLRILPAQLGGLLGNIVAAVPAVLALDVLVRQVTGAHIVDAPLAEHTLSGHAILGPTLTFAAVTGVMLWVSSIVGALAESWTRREGVAHALVSSPRALEGDTPRFASVATFLSSHVAGVAGNLSLGLMMGLVPALAAFFGLTFEVRHVTVSASAVTAAALAAPSGRPLLEAAAQVLAVAGVNMVVPFGLAFWLASSTRRPAPSVRAEDATREDVLDRRDHEPLDHPPADSLRR